MTPDDKTPTAPPVAPLELSDFDTSVTIHIPKSVKAELELLAAEDDRTLQLYLRRKLKDVAARGAERRQQQGDGSGKEDQGAPDAAE